MNASPEIHLFEPSGYGGVFQHACQLGQGLSRHDKTVVLHTGHEHEDVHVGGVELCACSWWPRRNGGGGRLRTVARQATIARSLVQRTLPHLLRAAPPGAVLHVQGVAASGALNVLTLGMARRKGYRVVYSPHDMFSRRGCVDGALLRLAYKVPHAIMVHSRADQERLQRLGMAPRVYFSPLVQLVPRPSEHERLSWRREWRVNGSDTVVLFAGFIRPEKRLDVLIESARSWPPGRRLAVVGPDRGGWAQCGLLAKAYDLDIAARLEFVELTEFTAAIAAADLVVVPSEKASQSGVLELARQLRTPTIAADVGGMPELASRTFAAGRVNDLSRAIAAELSNGSAAVEPRIAEDDAIHAHLRAYGERP